MTTTGSPERRKVLFIPAWYPSADDPVAGSFVREHARAASLHDDVTVLHVRTVPLSVWRRSPRWREEDDDGIATVRILAPVIALPVVKGVSYALGVLLAYMRLVRRGYRPDLIHAHVVVAGLPAAVISKLHRKPLLVTEHFTAFPRRTLSRAMRLVASFVFRQAAVVLPVSRPLQRAIEAYGINAPFKIVPNAVDTDLFHPGARQRPPATGQMLFVGLLDQSHKKGMPYLLRALAEVRHRRDDWHLHVLGDGPARAGYERLATDLGISDRVTWYGATARPEVAERMRQADFLVVPSLFETFSVVTAEALACGIPVVATRCGGPEEFLTTDTGIVTEPGDVNSLAAAINAMLDAGDSYDPEVISAYARRSFGYEAVGALLHKTYQEVLTRR